jgi:hypothetical protein
MFGLTTWLKLVPTWAYWLLALAVVAGGQQIRVLSAQSVASKAQVELANYRAEVSERDRRAAMFLIQENQRRQAAIEGIRRDAQEQIAAVAADAAAADDAASRLRARVAELSRRPANCPGSAGGGETADATRVLLAELQRRADEIAGGMAAFADRSRVAGLSCQAAYDSLKGN